LVGARAEVKGPLVAMTNVALSVAVSGSAHKMKFFDERVETELLASMSAEVAFGSASIGNHQN